ARTTLNLPVEGAVVLILCSALTPQDSAAMLQQFGRLQIPISFLVSAGHDPERERFLKQQFRDDSRFVIFGFSNEIARMMRASDLIVTKPGGLTVSEAMAVGVPQILLDPIPGQEEANARYAEGLGSAVRVRNGALFETLKDAIENK